MEEKRCNKKFRMGIIGVGHIAKAYVENILKLDNVEIVAASDLSAEKAAAFFEKYGLCNVRIYADYRELIDKENLDAVAVCTFNATHAECAVYALDRGVNVILEKPMCVTMEEAADILRAEKKSGKIMFVGFQPRFDNNIKEIKNIVESGKLGKVYYIRIGGGRRRRIPNRSLIEKKTSGFGALGDIGCYALDMVMNAIGYPKPLTVSGYKSSYFGANPKYNDPENAKRFDVDDFAAGFIRLEGGIIIDFITSWAMHIDTPGDTVILGTEGALRIPSVECWNGTMSGNMILYNDVDGEQTETSLPILPEVPEGLFYCKLKAFVDACREGKGKSPIPSSEIIYNQAIIDGLVRSSELGKEVEIVIPEI